ncbi:hypothetical protein GGI13_004601 [Coemansia sp. RSA 455]|nr:hypothetical protein LPJ71_001783 [Coemansia sp. S17]KAJ2016728.1 hypothetical protein GGI14_003442 [Coemansia sp. S680]KAJ2049434.1 hypothetical protein H4S04_003229 [Coemansia sp. S16]KAJ2057574.1 hypothetical protein GGI08_003598 [Coemansia sp. S2]KAJ2095895.1 hypothetical protein GGI09_004647 [Coemansia sp. S100]KAJ2248573.1 hypothetical protein GGI13_004601 [Coemansia sp. RSA 455]KAJ2348656.1 hypothetical protein GGH92_002763 [Coemansia sp. RSA 2673]KAJ2462758.1 hypothetical protein 
MTSITLFAKSTYLQVDEWLESMEHLIKYAGYDFSRILSKVDMSITSSWIRWVQREGKPHSWGSFKEYMTEEHYPRKSHRQLGYALGRLSTDQCIAGFNACFWYLAKALVMAGLYIAMIPVTFRIQAALLPEATPLRTVMDRVALYVDVHITEYNRDFVRSDDTKYTDFLPQTNNNGPRRRRNRGKGKGKGKSAATN